MPGVGKVDESKLTRRRSRVSRGALVIYVAALIYASLNPFVGWQLPSIITLFHWPKYVTFFDLTINVLAYVPLGGLLAALLRRRAVRFQARHAHAIAWCGASIGGFGLSLVLEIVQSLLPSRVSSPVDLLANTAGTIAGATILLMPLGRRMVAAFGRWRARHFAHDTTVDWGLLLMAIWFTVQLNPAIPFFEAGQVAAPSSGDPAASINATAYDPLILLPQAVGVALNVAAFSLFISLLLHRRKRALPNVCIILAGGLLAKFSMAALLLKGTLIAAALSPATVIGVGAGIILFTMFSKIRYRWRAFWASLFVFSGGVMAKLSSVYSALDETLRLFSWPYGQLANFTSLTRWLNEIWPLAALLFLAAIFIHPQPDSTVEDDTNT